MEQDIRYYEEVDSTNEEIRRLVRAGERSPFLTVFAGKQTEGRGRRGRIWHSPGNGSLYMSMLVPVDFSVEKASMVTLLVACSVKRALETLSVEAKIKWPNDLVVSGKKVCGILTELYQMEEMGHFLVVGVGVNLSLEHLPKELENIAIEVKEPIGREVLGKRIRKVFIQVFEHFVKEQNLYFIKEEYQRALVHLNQQIRVLDGKTAIEGIARGIDDEGKLLVEQKDGKEIAVYAGEVSVRGLYGYV